MLDNGGLGSVIWLDDDRGYAAVLLAEANNALNVALGDEASPVIAEIFDE